MEGLRIIRAEGDPIRVTSAKHLCEPLILPPRTYSVCLRPAMLSGPNSNVPLTSDGDASGGEQRHLRQARSGERPGSYSRVVDDDNKGETRLLRPGAGGGRGAGLGR